ncbi:hypothetical protein B7R56_25635 [Pseudomonas savastanoi pv. retacarpa]|nr:hypothetical protein BKM19_031220 [Pseudomonas amygdali pv. morsprunorum]KAA3533749.1 hypothetical protein DXU85_26570 [Pseudomonas savastanoi]KOP54298.1 hypothetical protein OX88_18525 [Pseudomonas coronafaciens pv. porri]OSR25690.1 hypothetical protein B7R56_25635 [Pseudomonas savastanoi pv. retacarpa]RML92179.1 hypothetical protein ALQ87_00926 [Pseudomonas savastanoi pv. glycinea]
MPGYGGNHPRREQKLLGGKIMSERDYNTVRNLHLSQLSDPKYLHLLREFAGHMAPPCVAEALMKWLNRL